MVDDESETGDCGETGGSGDAGECGAGDTGEEGGRGDAEEEGAGDMGDGGTSIALWFVIPCQTTLASRDVKLGAEAASTGAVSVSSPSFRDFGSSSELSDVSGDGSGEVPWLVKPRQIVSRRRELSAPLVFAAFDSSSLRLLNSTAV